MDNLTASSLKWVEEDLLAPYGGYSKERHQVHHGSCRESFQVALGQEEWSMGNATGRQAGVWSTRVRVYDVIRHKHQTPSGNISDDVPQGILGYILQSVGWVSDMERACIKSAIGACHRLGHWVGRPAWLWIPHSWRCPSTSSDVSSTQTIRFKEI